MKIKIIELYKHLSKLFHDNEEFSESYNSLNFSNRLKSKYLNETLPYLVQYQKKEEDQNFKIDVGDDFESEEENGSMIKNIWKAKRVKKSQDGDVLRQFHSKYFSIK